MTNMNRIMVAVELALKASPATIKHINNATLSDTQINMVAESVVESISSRVTYQVAVASYSQRQPKTEQPVTLWQAVRCLVRSGQFDDINNWADLEAAIVEQHPQLSDELNNLEQTLGASDRSNVLTHNAYFYRSGYLSQFGKLSINGIGTIVKG